MAPNGPANPPTPTPDRLLALLLKAQGNGARQLPRWGEGVEQDGVPPSQPGRARLYPSRSDPDRPHPSRSDPIRSHPSRSIPTHPDPSRPAPRPSDPHRSDPRRVVPAGQSPALPITIRSAPTPSVPIRPHPSRSAPTPSVPIRSDPIHPDPRRSDLHRTDTRRVEPGSARLLFSPQANRSAGSCSWCEHGQLSAHGAGGRPGPSCAMDGACEPRWMDSRRVPASHPHHAKQVAVKRCFPRRP